MVAEYRVDSPKVARYTYLVSYNFRDGSLISKDTILGEEIHGKGILDPDFGFDGKNLIYKNRYVISARGNTIDIETKSKVIEESDDFVESIGDTLIFHRNNSYKGKGFLLLNLATKAYQFINNDEWNKEERLSLSKKHSISIDKSSIPYKILLKQEGQNQKVIVSNAGHGPNITGGSRRPTVETHWLNDNCFLYAIHKLGNLDSSSFAPTQQFYAKYLSSVTIRKYDIENSSDTYLASIDSVQQGDNNGMFFKDGAGHLIYQTSGFKLYLIDPLKNSLLDYPFYELGHYFSRDNKWSKNSDKKIYYKKKEIGRFGATHDLVSYGIIAIRSMDEINVWSEKTKKWLTIPIPWISAAIGWIEKE